MPTPFLSTQPSADSEQFLVAQSYMLHRRNRVPSGPDLEAAWRTFHDSYSRKIRAYAFSCGASEEDIVDCVQDVWAELMIRLPTFQLDPSRGRFDSWLYQIVRTKTADQRRSRKRRPLQETEDTLQAVVDDHPNRVLALEDKELVVSAWRLLVEKLSECNLQILRMRLVEQRPVAEVAQALGISNEQVWYRFHRARREVERVGAVLARRLCLCEKFVKTK